MTEMMNESAPVDQDSVEFLREQNAEMGHRLAELEESWDQAAAALLRMRAEDKGWAPLSQIEGTDGFALDTIKRVVQTAEIQCVGNPLLTRGFALRHDGIFSKHFRIKGEQPPRVKRKLAAASIVRILMDPEGIEENERTLYTRGNLFVAYNRTTNTLMRVPIEQIANRATDPDDREVTAYYLRSYTRYDFEGKSEQVTEWYPTVEWWDQGLVKQTQVGQHPVNPDWVMIDMRVNVPASGHWGLPDAFAALPYAWAYSEYVRDASGLLKALNTIAWKVVNKTKAQSQLAGVRLSRAGQKGPGTAVMTEGTELTAMPKAGQVNMDDGLALAAMVASALQVPLTALTSNASIGGGYGSVASLDGPTVAMARARQQRWAAFYGRIFLAMGLKGLSLDFPKITEDPIHRQVSSLATGRATGAIWADEYRSAFLEATDTTALHDDAPPVEEYAQAQNALGFLSAMMGAVADAENDPLARQGNVGVAGSLGDVDNTNKQMDTRPGTGSMTGLE